MVQVITAITAYRRPGKRVYWDEWCRERIGKMRLDVGGQIAIQREHEWVMVAADYPLYSLETSVKPQRRRKNASVG